MSGTIELDRDGKTLLIGFPYREDLVDEVRGLPGRRWDRGSRMWKVPIEHAELVVSTFMKHGFEVSGDVSGILAGTNPQPAAEPTKTRALRLDDQPGENQTDDPNAGLTVSQLNERARTALREAFTTNIRVIGEVVDFDKNRDRQHIFFTLAEKDAAGHRIAATVSVAMFERTAKRVLPKVERQGLSMRDGVEIMIEAKVDLYPASGRFQLILEDIRPEFTLGKLALDREAVLRDLRKADLDERNASLPWPLPSLRIGVLTSPTSDAWNDFLREIEASEIGFDISLYPVKVQGEGLAPTMLAGLAWFADHADNIDVVCILRGGGSRTDLAWFDNRDVAFAVAKHPLKILCGIGHERDSSVLDEISTSRKTPTAVAAFLVGQIESAEEVLREQSHQLRNAAQRLLRVAHTHLADVAHGLRRLVHGRMVGERARLDNAARRTVTSSTVMLQRSGHQLRTNRTRLVDLAERRINRERDRLVAWDTKRRLLDPERILNRGYAMVQTVAATDSNIVKSAQQLTADQKIRITFRDGHADATVTDTVSRPVNRETEAS